MPTQAVLHTDGRPRGKAISQAFARQGFRAVPAGPHTSAKLHVIDLSADGARDLIVQLRHENVPLLGLYERWPEVTAAMFGLRTRSALILAGPDQSLDLAFASAARLVPERRDTLRKKLAEHRQRFAAHLPDRIATLSAAVQALGQNASTEALHEARRLAHSLKGTAATFGFPRLSTLARSLEEILTRGPGGAQAAAVISELQAETNPGAEPWIARLAVFDQDAEFFARLAASARESLIEVSPVRSLAEAPAHASADGFLIDTGFGGSEEALLKLLKKLAAHPVLRDMPLAFYSHNGSANRNERILAQAAGGRLFVADPLDSAELSRAAHVLASLRRRGAPRVLVIDDDREFADYVAEILVNDGMQVAKLHDPEHVLDALAREEPELLLLDVTLPHVNGFDVCRMLRMEPRWQDLPVLFLTARAGSVPRMVAYQAGGDDFVQKPIVADDLLARIRQRISRTRLLRERLERDPLTGLATRETFFEELRRLLGQAGRRNEPVSIFVLDLDRFKEINDTHGHTTGDRVLAGFGTFLSRSTRQADLCGRFGGDEFALAMAGMRLNEAAPFAERLRDEWAGIEFKTPDGAALTVSFSAGMACYPDDGMTADQLFARADAGLLYAKSLGRNFVTAGVGHGYDNGTGA